jgi:hypothetical protein
MFYSTAYTLLVKSFSATPVETKGYRYGTSYDIPVRYTVRYVSTGNESLDIPVVTHTFATKFNWFLKT